MLHTGEMVRSRHTAARSLTVALGLLILPVAAFAATLRDEAVGYRCKGYELQMQGDLAGALAMYKKSAALDPAYATPHNDMGVILEQLGRLEEAERSYLRAVEIAPSYAKVHANLAMLYERLGRIDQAIYHWSQRVHLGRPDDPATQRARERLAALLTAPLQVEALASRPFSPEQRSKAAALRAEGYRLQQERKFEEALERYRMAVEADPTYAAPYNDMGVIYEDRGDMDSAEKAYQQALALDPGYVQAHANLALLYERMGRQDKSLYHWLKRYQLGQPGSPGTQRARERLLALGMTEDVLAALPSVSPTESMEEEIPGMARATVESQQPVEPQQEPVDAGAAGGIPDRLVTGRETGQQMAASDVRAEPIEAPQDDWGPGVVSEDGMVVAEPIPLVSASLDINSGAQQAKVPTVILDIDATLVGQPDGAADAVRFMQFSNDGVNFSPLEPYESQRIWTLSEGDGTKTVFMNLLDDQKRVLASLHDTIELDTSSLTIYVNSEREQRQRLVDKDFKELREDVVQYEKNTKRYSD